MGSLTINEDHGNQALSAETIALAALGWLLQDGTRADRLLSLTGLTPDHLRNGLSEPRVLGAVLEFLANHEPDLIAAADAIDMAPEAIIAAHKELSQ